MWLGNNASAGDNPLIAFQCGGADMSSYNPHIDKVSDMTCRLMDKHIGEMSWCTLKWEVLEIYDPHNWEHPIMQVVPIYNVSFKR